MLSMIASMEMHANARTFEDRLHADHRKHSIASGHFSFIKEG